MILKNQIEYLIACTKNYLNGDFSQKINAELTPEMVELAETINKLTLKVQASDQFRRDFVANVSHELRTPITSIKGFIETLREGAIDNPNDSKRFLNIIAEQSDRLNAIIDDLLTLSKIEHQEFTNDLQRESANIYDLIQTVAAGFSQKISQKNLTLKLSISPDLQAITNQHLFQQAISNLLGNAIKYTNVGKSIEISAKVEMNNLIINVIDQGIGIEAQHLPRIFERFYVVDKARSRKLGGTGLGLAIVKHIAIAHGGSVEVQSQLGEGTQFTLFLSQL